MVSDKEKSHGDFITKLSEDPLKNTELLVDKSGEPLVDKSIPLPSESGEGCRTGSVSDHDLQKRTNEMMSKTGFVPATDYQHQIVATLRKHGHFDVPLIAGPATTLSFFNFGDHVGAVVREKGQERISHMFYVVSVVNDDDGTSFVMKEVEPEVPQTTSSPFFNRLFGYIPSVSNGNEWKLEIQ